MSVFCEDCTSFKSFLNCRDCYDKSSYVDKYKFMLERRKQTGNLQNVKNENK